MAPVKHLILILVHIAVYAGLWALAQPELWLGTVLLASLLIWVSCRDFAVFEVPDLAAMALIVTGVVLAEDAAMSVLAALLWSAVFLVVQVGARRVMGHDALGLGDVKLMAGVGAWLGLVAPIYVVLAASVAAILTMIVIAATRGQSVRDLPGMGIAFGPFICLSAWAIWVGVAI